MKKPYKKPKLRKQTPRIISRTPYMAVPPMLDKFSYKPLKEQLADKPQQT